MRGAGEGDSHEQRIVADCLQTAKTFVIRAVLSLLYESLAVLQLVFVLLLFSLDLRNLRNSANHRRNDFSFRAIEV